jgi:4-amino-4-deoxy-L-arabinose transferase-like glycosyltransferase
MVLFTVIFALGIFMRIYHVDSIPPGLHGDEAWSGIEAVEILEGRPYTPYSPNVYGQTTLYFYFVAFLFKLLGVTPVAIRLVSVVFGILTIPAFYLLARKACSAEVALCASFLLAVSRWHITLSRIGMMMVLGSFFAVLTFYYLLRALDSKYTLDFVLSGVFLSFGLNGYMAFRLIPFVFILFLCFLLSRYKEQIVGNVKGLALFFASALVTITPLALYALCNWDIFMGRVGAINIFKDHTFTESMYLWGDNIRATLLMFNYEGSVWPHKNLPGEQMLDPIIAIFFVLGLALALYRWHARTNFLLLCWFGVALLPGFLSLPAADPFRTIIAPMITGSPLNTILSLIHNGFIPKLFLRVTEME